jgi:hypothetical protein
MADEFYPVVCKKCGRRGMAADGEPKYSSDYSYSERAWVHIRTVQAHCLNPECGEPAMLARKRIEPANFPNPKTLRVVRDANTEV